MQPSLSANLGSSAASSSSRTLPGATPSTLPSDPSEISETAQALLQAHYDRLKNSSSSSSSTTSTNSQSLLARLERAASNIDRICLQLDNFSVSHQLHAGKSTAEEATRTLQPLGPLAFWPARVVFSGDASEGKLWVRQSNDDGLSLENQLKVEDEGLPMLTKSPKAKEGEGLRVQVKLVEPSRTVEVKYVRMTYKDAQMQLQSRRAKLLAAARELREKLGKDAVKSVSTEGTAAAAKDMHLLNEDNQALNEEGLPFYEPVEEISEEEATRQNKAYMQPFVRSEAADKNQRKRWLEDTLTKLEEEEQNEESDAEEGVEEMPSASSSSTPTLPEAEPSVEDETRVVLRTRTPSPPPSPEDVLKTKALPEIVSATRPPPPKSALKTSAARPDIVQRPSFGSSGIRHGFLNLNPSSPGAIKSSYSWEDLEKEEKPKSAEPGRPSKSHTPTPLSRVSSTAESSLLSRITDANSSPVTSGTSTPTKKSVRIKSPERAHPQVAAGSGLTPLQRALRSSIRVKENYNEPSASQQQQPNGTVSALERTDSGSGTAEKRHKDDVGVEEEAERIVKLLGPDVVEGHPSAPPSDVLKKMQEAHEEDKRLSTPEAAAARAKREEEDRERERLERLAEKPALGHSVMERPRSSAEKGKGKEVADQIKSNQAKFSAFKAGFLNQKPAMAKKETRFVPNMQVPRKAAGAAAAPPTQSLGMSALDRASLGDDKLSRRREEMGLPAAVPHARPSKSYAEKMAARQQGQTPTSADPEDVAEKGSVKLARPVEGDDVPRPGRVRFGPPAGSSHADEEEEQDEGMEINPSAELDNHNPEEGELDEEQEEPKIEGEGADTDGEDAYFDEYLSGRSRKSAAAKESRGLDDEHDNDEADDFDDDEDEDWDVDEDDFDFDEDEDDDFDYDPEDLMALAPRMGDVEGLARNPELMREYEEAKAKLAAMGLAMRAGAGGSDDLRAQMVNAARSTGGEGEEEEGEEEEGEEKEGEEKEGEEDDYQMDLVPLDAAMEDPEYQGNTTTSAGSGSRISRFKASLRQQAMAPTPRGGDSLKLEEMLSSAKNLGASNSAAFSMDGMGSSAQEEGGGGTPMMIIPQLAPVRFPKHGDLVEGKTSGPVDLDGAESDEDDEKAEMVMRSRLERLQWKREHPEDATRLNESKKAKEMVEQGVAPPPVVPRRQEIKKALSGEGGTAVEGREEAEDAPKPKKVSRFKAARMGQ
ncbi:hypothetical protein NDA12_001086 [Ustilago hordei]|nr:hypothetical protein NDA12_001086 [Ustilago hordei]KAJ1574545.1 hypothetical protein NDA15_005191 [Ustilago hordei]